ALARRRRRGGGRASARRLAWRRLLPRRRPRREPASGPVVDSRRRASCRAAVAAHDEAVFGLRKAVHADDAAGAVSPARRGVVVWPTLSRATDVERRTLRHVC